MSLQDWTHILRKALKNNFFEIVQFKPFKPKHKPIETKLVMAYKWLYIFHVLAECEI